MASESIVCECLQVKLKETGFSERYVSRKGSEGELPSRKTTYIEIDIFIIELIDYSMVLEKNIFTAITGINVINGFSTMKQAMTTEDYNRNSIHWR